MSRLQSYLSAEDHDGENDVEVGVTTGEAEVDVGVTVPPVEPVSEEEEEEADEVLEDTEADEVAQEAFYAEQDGVLDEAFIQMESMESYVDVLTHGLAREEYSPQAASIIQANLETHRPIMGVEDGKAALENHTTETLAQYYQDALEDYTDAYYKYAFLPDRVMYGIFEHLTGTNAHNKRLKEAASLIKKADAGLEELAGFNASTKVEISIKGLHKTLGVNGKVSGSILRDIKQNQGAVNELLTKYVEQSVKYTEDLVENGLAAAKHVNDGDNEKADSVVSKMAAVEIPEESLSKGIRDGSTMMANSHVVVDEVDRRQEAVDVFQALVKREKPKLDTVAPEKDTDTVTLTVKDIRNILNAVKENAEMAKKANENVYKNISRVKKQRFGSSARIQNEDKALKIFRDNRGLQLMNRFAAKQVSGFVNLVSQTFSHNTKVSKGLIKLADRGVSAAIKAEKEAGKAKDTD